jgi:mRNA interferase MazF
MIGVGHGQVWWADLSDQKVRPVVILTRSAVAPLLGRLLVAPVTTTVRGITTEVSLGRAEGLKEGSVANLDNAQLLSTDRLLRRAGSVAVSRWPEFCRAIDRVLSC